MKNTVENFKLVATCKLGLEGFLAKELKALGYETENFNGEVHFEGDSLAIVKSNLWLRTAERVLIYLTDFPAQSFDELFDGMNEILWEKLIPRDGLIDIVPKCVNSKILSRRSTQSICKKAIVAQLQEYFKVDWLSENGPVFKIHVDIVKDKATILLDTSGAGLHKRGYRQHAGIAPLRETMAVALILASNWTKEKPLFDPFCGAGTIPIEAAMLARNQAPGLNRQFDAEFWPFLNSEEWQEERAKAQKAIQKSDFKIYASDLDEKMVEIARKNAKLAGVAELIEFRQKDIRDFAPKTENGVVICNPPYGERLSELQECEAIFKTMGQVLPVQKNWHYHILSSHPEFEKIFGRKALRNRKMYNGKIKCYLYSFE